MEHEMFLFEIRLDKTNMLYNLFFFFLYSSRSIRKRQFHFDLIQRMWKDDNIDNTDDIHLTATMLIHIQDFQLSTSQCNMIHNSLCKQRVPIGWDTSKSSLETKALHAGIMSAQQSQIDAGFQNLLHFSAQSTQRDCDIVLELGSVIKCNKIKVFHYGNPLE